MLVSNLTKPLSKRLLFALIIITIGTELLLYFSRYSGFLLTIYDSILVASFFVGLKLHQRLRPINVQPMSKLKLMHQFALVYLLFSSGSFIFNIFSSEVFEEFSAEYEEEVESYTESIESFDEDLAAGEYGDEVHPIFQWLDMVGYDFYSDALAGLEEVYRLSYIILILLLLKKFFPQNWGGNSNKVFLTIALILSSILFGLSHAWDSEYDWSYIIGSGVNFTLLGLLFGILLLWTRNLWLLVVVHSVYDIVVSINNYYFDWAAIGFDGIMAITYIVLHFILRNTSTNNLRSS